MLLSTSLVIPLTPMHPKDSAAIVKFSLPYTMLDEIRLMGLIQETERVVKSRVPGSITECGVWKGGSMMAVAMAIIRMGVTDREFYLFDTYAGMPPPEEVDVDLHGRPALDPTNGSCDRPGCTVPLSEVQKAMALTGYPPDKIHYIVGKVEDTLPSHSPGVISLLHLDMDWYRPTRHALDHLFPLLSPNGCLMTDDYGHWRGAKKAMDEYMVDHLISTPLVPHGYTAVSLMKAQGC